MTIYFKSGFYHGTAPEGAIEISEETYRTLLEGQSEGKTDYPR
ncbi:hypothetical protein [Avibacterium paragallinarum]|nr:hypothetical protein [Avibacterium paragallinarum]